MQSDPATPWAGRPASSCVALSAGSYLELQQFDSDWTESWILVGKCAGQCGNSLCPFVSCKLRLVEKNLGQVCTDA